MKYYTKQKACSTFPHGSYTVADIGWRFTKDELPDHGVYMTILSNGNSQFQSFTQSGFYYDDTVQWCRLPEPLPSEGEKPQDTVIGTFKAGETITHDKIQDEIFNVKWNGCYKHSVIIHVEELYQKFKQRLKAEEKQ